MAERPTARGTEVSRAPRDAGHADRALPREESRNGHDELNVARLSLISPQSRVPAGYTGWTRTYQTGERTVTVTCTALTGLVVPHGLDNDVMDAIINLSLENACPEDGTIRVSLRRLQSTSDQITQGWWSQGRQQHLDATFNYAAPET